MQRCLRMKWLVLLSALSACTQLVDFDRSKIPSNKPAADAGGSTDDGGSTLDGGKDSSVADSATDGMMTAVDTGVDSGPIAQCDLSTNASCAMDQLCCDKGDGAKCVDTNATSDCSACGTPCDSLLAVSCVSRVCECEWGSGKACSGSGKERFCVGNAGSAKCQECRGPSDCAGNADGKTLCIAGECVQCDPSNNVGCSNPKPICDATSKACVACDQTHSCGGLTCSNGSCFGCDPNTNAGCSATSSTPFCKTAGGGMYQCAGCAAGDCSGNATHPRCAPAGDTKAGQCVECTQSSQCPNDKPICDGNVCRKCATATEDVDCTDPAKPACGPAGTCVPCRTGGSRTTCASEDVCVNNACADCNTTNNTQCPDSGKPLCNTTTNKCVQCLSPADCNDSDMCTTDTCSGSGTCQHAAVSTSDGVSCTTDSCSPASGVSHTPNNGACTPADSFSCTVPTCNATTDCSDVPDNTACNDTFACTSDACLGQGGLAGTGCKFTPDNSKCSDSFTCTTNACVGAGGDSDGCKFTPDNTKCGDAYTCTTDTCVGAGGDATTGCKSTPDDSKCSDAYACTTDACVGAGGDGTTGCKFTPDNSKCDDSIDCTVDSCAGAGGGLDGCKHEPNDAACDDNNALTVDTCSATLGCVHV